MYIERYFEIAHGFTHDDLFLSVDPQSIVISESNDLPLINNSNTFFAKGLVATVVSPDPSYLSKNISGQASIQQQQEQEQQLNQSRQNSSKNQIVETTLLYLYPRLASGSWALNVSKGVVIDFQADFKLVTINGMDKHFVQILNFRNADDFPAIFDQFSNTTINGFADIKIDNDLFRKDFPLTIQIFKINTIALDFKDELVANIFYNNNLLGITDSFKNFKNDELLIVDEDDNDT
ncbi:MAG TPA: hypothetical protein VD815_08060 [Candidatus Saccharimonadales bacterium]|nr:hypothetical protein [Candidatus Saccharimonadales bacterium]